MAFISTNPCLCNSCGGTTPVAVNCPEVDANCFDLCDLVLTQDNEAGTGVVVGPCGKEGVVDYSSVDVGHNFTLCNGVAPSWSIVSYDTELFVEVTIDSSTGIVNWTTGDFVATKYVGEVVVKATCGKYGAYGKIFIGIKDLCRDVSCTSQQSCEKCTGQCVDENSNIVVQSGTVVTSTGNVSISNT